MIITQMTLNDLTVGQQYTNMKFAVLQRTLSIIEVTANDGANATVDFYDPTGTTVVYTLIYNITMAVWFVDLTQ